MVVKPETKTAGTTAVLQVSVSHYLSFSKPEYNRLDVGTKDTLGQPTTPTIRPPNRADEHDSRHWSTLPILSPKRRATVFSGRKLEKVYVGSFNDSGVALEEAPSNRIQPITTAENLSIQMVHNRSGSVCLSPGQPSRERLARANSIHRDFGSSQGEQSPVRIPFHRGFSNTIEQRGVASPAPLSPLLPGERNIMQVMPSEIKGNIGDHRSSSYFIRRRLASEVNILDKIRQNGDHAPVKFNKNQFRINDQYVPNQIAYRGSILGRFASRDEPLTPTVRSKIVCVPEDGKGEEKPMNISDLFVNSENEHNKDKETPNSPVGRNLQPSEAVSPFSPIRPIRRTIFIDPETQRRTIIQAQNGGVIHSNGHPVGECRSATIRKRTLNMEQNNVGTISIFRHE